MSSELNHTQCLKIAEKVAFNIASEASYVYITFTLFLAFLMDFSPLKM